MPIRDFSITGVANLRETVSNSFDAITRSLAEADTAMESVEGSSQEVGVAFAELAGVGIGLENQIDEISDEMRELSVTSQAAVASLAEVQTASQFFGRNVGLFDADELLEVDDFMENIRRRLDIDKPRFGGIVKGAAGPDVDTLDDLIRALQVASAEGVTTERIIEAVAESARDLSQSSAMAIPPTTAAAESIDHMGDEAEEADRDIGGLSRALLTLNASAVGSLPGILQLPLLFKSTQTSGEGLSDELEELASAFSDTGSTISNVSANIGPFNVGLRNIAITLPAILTVIGPIVVILGAMAAALLAVTAAVAALAAVGAVAFFEDFEEAMGDAAETSEVMMEIFEGVKMAVFEAIEPLQNISFLGLAPSEFFLGLMQDTIFFIHQLAEAFAILLSGDSGEVIAEQFMRFRNALLGISDETEGISLIEALSLAIVELLPVVTDLIVAFVDLLPDFIQFGVVISNEILPSLLRLGGALIDLASAFTRFGGEVLPSLFNVLAVFFSVFADFIDVIAAILDWMGPWADAFITIIVVAGVLAAAISFVASAIVGLIGPIVLLNLAMSALGVQGGLLGGVFALLTGSSFSLAGALSVLTGAISAVGSALLSLLLNPAFLVIAAIVGIIAALIWMVTHMQKTLDIIHGASDALSDFFEWLGLSADQADLLADALTTLALGPLGLVKLLFEQILNREGAFALFLETIVRWMLGLVDAIKGAAEEAREAGILPTDEGERTRRDVQARGSATTGAAPVGFGGLPDILGTIGRAIVRGLLDLVSLIPFGPILPPFGPLMAPTARGRRNRTAGAGGMAGAGTTNIFVNVEGGRGDISDREAFKIGRIIDSRLRTTRRSQG